MLNIKKIFNSFGFIKDLKRNDHTPSYGALDIFKYIGMDYVEPIDRK